MKITFLIYPVIILVVVLFLTTNCKKEEPASLAQVSTTSATNTTATTSTSGGNITSNGGATITVRGICWSTTANPTTSDSKTTDGVGIGQFVSEITGLTAGLNYHVRAYATNSIGTAYGADIEFLTLGQAPTSVTQPATNVSGTVSTLNGAVNANYLTTEITFEYGITTSYGKTVTATQSPVTGSSNTNVSAGITGLIGGTIYHFRVKSVNSIGITIGNDLTFTTLGEVPYATTQAATSLTTTGATLNGIVNANFLSTTVSFEYGLTTGYGQSATATQSPVTESSNTNVSAGITGLLGGTIYHFRVKAVNSLGTSDGSDMTFTTPPLIVFDIDGNSYNTIKIGTQVWMKENLKTTKYNDGTVIPNIKFDADWINLTTGSYNDYDNIPSNSNTYGRLYNWYTVDNNAATKVASNGGKNVCPTGWHVPTDTEWTILTDYLTSNGYGYGGSGNDIAKSMAATSGWRTIETLETLGTVGNNQASNNRSGFTALPSGNRFSGGIFLNVGNVGYWWSSTESSSTYAYPRFMGSSGSNVYRNVFDKLNGFSVRCLRD